MIKEGFFPLGNKDLTGTRISAFEHDLAHFTAFIENPQFMKEVKKLASLDQHIPDFYEKDERMYYFFEGMITIAHPEKLMNTLHFTKEMKDNPYQVRLNEMVEYLEKLPVDELEKSRIDLIKNADYYFL